MRLWAHQPIQRAKLPKQGSQIEHGDHIEVESLHRLYPLWIELQEHEFSLPDVRITICGKIDYWIGGGVLVDCHADIFEDDRVIGIHSGYRYASMALALPGTLAHASACESSILLLS